MVKAQDCVPLALCKRVMGRGQNWLGAGGYMEQPSSLLTRMDGLRKEPSLLIEAPAA